MSKSFTGNEFLFRTQSRNITNFRFDDPVLYLDANLVQVKNALCASAVQNTSGSTMMSFNNNVIDLHNCTLINGAFEAETTEYVFPLYRTSTGTFELSTDGNAASSSNRYALDSNTIGIIKARILVKKADMSRYAVYNCEFSVANVSGTASITSDVNLERKCLVGSDFTITFGTTAEYLTLTVAAGSDTVLAKAFVEHYSY